jgi:hypothetical protein
MRGGNRFDPQGCGWRLLLAQLVMMPTMRHLLLTAKIEPSIAPRRLKGASAQDANGLLGLTRRPF